MFSLEMFNRKMFSRSVSARLSLGALFAALCWLPACSITANDKSKDGEKHVTSSLPSAICTSASKPTSATLG